MCTTKTHLYHSCTTGPRLSHPPIPPHTHQVHPNTPHLPTGSIPCTTPVPLPHPTPTPHTLLAHTCTTGPHKEDDVTDAVGLCDHFAVESRPQGGEGVVHAARVHSVVEVNIDRRVIHQVRHPPAEPQVNQVPRQHAYNID